MAVQFDNLFPVDLNNGPAIVMLKPLHASNAKANKVGLTLTKNGEPVEITGSCSGTAILNDHSTVVIENGIVEGNLAYIVLPAACYSVPGDIRIFVTVTNGANEAVTLLSASGYVRVTETDTYIDPGTVLPTINTLIDLVQSALDSIPADYSDLQSFAEKQIGGRIASFELGDLYVNSEGTGTYYNSLIRLRTPQNTYISLKAGDVLQFIDSDGKQFRLYSKNAATSKYTSVTNKWISDPFTVPSDITAGVILLRYVGEPEITDKDTLADQFQIWTKDSGYLQLSDVYHTVTAETEKTRYHDFIPGGSTLTVYGNEKAFGNAMAANGRNYMPDYSASGTTAGVTYTVEGQFIQLNGTATGSGRTDAVDCALAPSVDIPAGSYTFRFAWNANGSTLGNTKRVFLQAQYKDGTSAQLINKYVNSSFNETVSITKEVSKIRLVVGTYAGNVYTDAMIWVGLYPSTTVFEDLGSTVPSSGSISVESPFSTDGPVDTMQHESTAIGFANLKQYIDSKEIDINDKLTYVTPERFGAVGDGVAYDTDALADCISYAVENQVPVRAMGRYKTASPLTITGEYLDIWINQLTYTGTSSAAIVFSARYSRLTVGYLRSYGIGLLVQDDSSASYGAVVNQINCGLIYANGDGVKLNGVSHDVSYNQLMLKRVHSANGSCLVSDGQTSENIFFGTSCIAPSGWAVYRGRGRYYSIAMEDNVLNGIYMEGNDNAIFIGCRHTELMNKLVDRIDGHDPTTTGGTVIKMVGGFPTIKYVSEQNLCYGAVDVTEMYKVSDVSTTDDRNHACRISQIDAPIFVGDGATQNGYCCYGHRMYIIAGYKVCVPAYESLCTVTDADFDMRDAQFMAGNARPYATRFKIDAADCVIHLASSYCPLGYNRIIIDQSTVGKLCTVYSDKSNTPIFDGATLGTGVYQLTCVSDSANNTAAYRTNHQYDGKNDKWIITNVGADSPLFHSELPNTIQEITYGMDGKVQSILHKFGNTTIRTDAFTFNGAVVTETRTLSTGESLTIATNRNTKVTTVTYSVA